MKNFVTWITLVGLSVFLSACAGMNSKFDCPMQPGVMCKSLDQVNTLVDHQEIGGDTPCKECENLKSAHSTTSLIVSQDNMKIWIAPYTDSDHNRYTASYMYTNLAERKNEARQAKE